MTKLHQAIISHLFTESILPLFCRENVRLYLVHVEHLLEYFVLWRANIRPAVGTCSAAPASTCPVYNSTRYLTNIVSVCRQISILSSSEYV